MEIGDKQLLNFFSKTEIWIADSVWGNICDTHFSRKEKQWETKKDKTEENRGREKNIEREEGAIKKKEREREKERISVDKKSICVIRSVHKFQEKSCQDEF